VSKPLRILIVDDHPLLREGIVGVLQAEQDISVVAQASSGRAAIAYFREHRPDVTLMDLQMSDIDGVAATAAICAEHPGARIVVLTTYRKDARALRALQAGAMGFLLKSLIPTELFEAIRAVHSGHRYICRDIAAELAAHVTDDQLTMREIEVLRCVAAGNSNQRVASQISVSEDTVKAHMKSIMSKLGANDRTHAVTIAIRRGIIDM
jgi:DNA-binding NarL/FixJ family response regulator